MYILLKKVKLFVDVLFYIMYKLSMQNDLSLSSSFSSPALQARPEDIASLPPILRELYADVARRFQFLPDLDREILVDTNKQAVGFRIEGNVQNIHVQEKFAALMDPEHSGQIILARDRSLFYVGHTQRHTAFSSKWPNRPPTMEGVLSFLARSVGYPPPHDQELITRFMNAGTGQAIESRPGCNKA